MSGPAHCCGCRSDCRAYFSYLLLSNQCTAQRLLGVAACTAAEALCGVSRTPPVDYPH